MAGITLMLMLGPLDQLDQVSDFEFGFDASSLREFLRLGAEAARELEAT